MKRVWHGHLVTTLFELDLLTLRASADAAAARTREYELLDAQGGIVGRAAQEGGSAMDFVKRNVARSRATMPADFTVRDSGAAVVLTVAKRRVGRLLPKVGIEARLANGVVVAVARSHGRPARQFDVTDPHGRLVATLRRGAGGALFAIADDAGRPAGSVAMEANTMSARQSGAAHPNGYAISFGPGAGALLRIGSLSAVLGFDSLRGV